MRLELVRPPRLVTVDSRPALLMATRGDRHYVQVSAGAGLNTLRWVPAAALGPPEQVSPPVGLPDRPGLPWIRSRAER